MTGDVNPVPEEYGSVTPSLTIRNCAEAIEAGAEATMEPDDMFWGDRMCAVVDPYGHQWSLASRVEELSREEMERRRAEALEERTEER